MRTDPTPPPSDAAAEGAAVIARAFDSWIHQFRDLTRAASRHFEVRDIHGWQRDSVRRLDLYGECVALALSELHSVLGDRLEDRPTWAALRGRYAENIPAS